MLTPGTLAALRGCHPFQNCGPASQSSQQSTSPRTVTYAHSDCRIPIRGKEEPGLDQYQMNIAEINALAVDAGGVIRKEVYFCLR
jgi:hypothetical protein